MAKGKGNSATRARRRQLAAGRVVNRKNKPRRAAKKK